MKKFKNAICIMMIVLFSFMMFGCGNSKTIDGRKYETYGLFNKDENKHPDIHYRVSVGNVVWSVLLFETLVMPIYFIGFSLWEPVQTEEAFNKRFETDRLEEG